MALVWDNVVLVSFLVQVHHFRCFPKQTAHPILDSKRISFLLLQYNPKETWMKIQNSLLGIQIIKLKLSFTNATMQTRLFAFLRKQMLKTSLFQLPYRYWILLQDCTTKQCNKTTTTWIKATKVLTANSFYFLTI